jgi:hypothetical protein
MRIFVGQQMICEKKLPAVSIGYRLPPPRVAAKADRALKAGFALPAPIDHGAENLNFAPGSS